MSKVHTEGDRRRPAPRRSSPLDGSRTVLHLCWLLLLVEIWSCNDAFHRRALSACMSSGSNSGTDHHDRHDHSRQVLGNRPCIPVCCSREPRSEYLFSPNRKGLSSSHCLLLDTISPVCEADKKPSHRQCTTPFLIAGDNPASLNGFLDLSDRIESPIGTSSDQGIYLRETCIAFKGHKALLKALVVDVTSAVVAGIGVAPIVTVIDLAVTEVAFGHKPFLDSVRAAMPKLICRPHRILLTRPFCYMFLLYAGTYTAANLIDTVSTDVEGRRSGAMTSSLTKLSTVSAVNLRTFDPSRCVDHRCIVQSATRPSGKPAGVLGQCREPPNHNATRSPSSKPAHSYPPAPAGNGSVQPAGIAVPQTEDRSHPTGLYVDNVGKNVASPARTRAGQHHQYQHKDHFGKTSIMIPISGSARHKVSKPFVVATTVQRPVARSLGAPALDTVVGASVDRPGIGKYRTACI
nr:hypothetical protein CFP56_21356 [Quercus suber]